MLVTIVLSFSIEYNMFQYEHCPEVPMESHRLSSRFPHGGGGTIVVVEGSVMLGGIDGNLYRLDERKHKWDLVTKIEVGATLGVYGGKLVAVGGMFSSKVMVQEGEKWTLMSEIPFWCAPICVVSVGEWDLLVMGGSGDEKYNGILVFNGKTKIWHTGPQLLQLPWPHFDFDHVSAVVHEDLVFATLSIQFNEHVSVYYAKISDLVSTILSYCIVERTGVVKLTCGHTHIHDILVHVHIRTMLSSYTCMLPSRSYHCSSTFTRPLNTGNRHQAGQSYPRKRRRKRRIFG